MRGVSTRDDVGCWSRRYSSGSSSDWEHSRNVAVDDLNHDQCPVVGHDVEGLSLDVGVLVRLPLQVLFGQDGIGGFRSLSGNRLNGLGAIDGLFRANGRGETVKGRLD